MPDQDKVKQHLQEMFSKVEEEKLNSLAIPLKMCDSLPEVTLLQHFNAAFNKPELKYLKVIYLCYEDIQMTEKLTMMLKSGQNSLNFYDFSKVPTYRDKPLKDKENPVDVTFRWTQGDIIDQKTDIIVNSTNKELQLKKGAVSLSILKKVGNSLAEKCHEKYPNGIDYGSLAITSGEKCWKYIYHFALPSWTVNAEFSKKIFEQAVYNCLIQAEKDKCNSIAFPVLGTGKLKYPWDDVARTMRNAFCKFKFHCRHINLKEMIVVLHPDDKRSIEAFETWIGKQSYLDLFSEELLHQTKSILEARCNVTKIIILHLPSTRFHQSDALITISDPEHASPVLKNIKDGMIKDKQGCTFWSIKVCSNKTNYIRNMGKVLEFILEERLSTITISLLENDDTLPLRRQSKIIRDLVLENENNRYLQLVKLIVLDGNSFASLLSETEQRKLDRRSRLMPGKNVFGLSKPTFKAVTYSETSQLPKLIISAKMEDVIVVSDLEEKLKVSLNEALV
ncbi:protein mono-ADP-ribosyltransferase PARP14-like [Mytilus californianus]|uniref:protein mono-ADP-ribosyltransferase PARP14-like n=1 Tax=Mytilus californianus TaxID=6549 RepID=UPI0022476BE9|nr:protein mono-ADP-ribosyltransferase PARP14-like [Mytilus californianus]